MSKHTSGPVFKTQSGVMLLEALIGILIFSLGILSLVGMQTIAIRATTDARDRTEASSLATEIIGDMWLDRANLAGYAYDGSGTPPAALDPWVTQVEGLLPGVTTNHPTVVISPSVLGASVGTETTVTVNWQNSTGATVHSFVMTAYIN